MYIVGKCLLLPYIPEDIVGPHLSGRFEEQTAVGLFIVIHCQMTMYDTIEVKPGMPMDLVKHSLVPRLHLVLYNLALILEQAVIMVVVIHGTTRR